MIVPHRKGDPMFENERIGFWICSFPVILGNVSQAALKDYTGYHRNGISISFRKQQRQSTYMIVGCFIVSCYDIVYNYLLCFLSVKFNWTLTIRTTHTHAHTGIHHIHTPMRSRSIRSTNFTLRHINALNWGYSMTKIPYGFFAGLSLPISYSNESFNVFFASTSRTLRPF